MKQYITIFEDGTTIEHISGELPGEILTAFDMGLYEIIDITDPTKPLQYNGDGNWLSVERETK